MPMKTNDLEKLWLIVRRANDPNLRRTLPVGYVINHRRKRVLDCACCGATISYDGGWRKPKRVLEFLQRHNRINHILANFDFDGTLAGVLNAD